MVHPERVRLVLEEAHLRALVDRRVDPGCQVAVVHVLGRRRRARIAAAPRRSSPPCVSVSYVLTLFAFQRARPSVVTAEQPTETRLRTTHGADRHVRRRASDRDDDPDGAPLDARAHRRRSRRSASGSAASRTLPRIPSPSASPSRAAMRSRRTRRDDERQEDDRRREELVEDLPVQVHVVPDQVRMERRQRRGDEADVARRRRGARSRRRSASSRSPRRSARGRRPPSAGRRSSRAGRGRSRTSGCV